jgi:DNA-binding NarL/FixJ family response regulator
MKYMSRKQLAQAAGVSERTLRTYINSIWHELQPLGCTSRRLLTPAAVKYICYHYGIDLE